MVKTSNQGTDTQHSWVLNSNNEVAEQSSYVIAGNCVIGREKTCDIVLATGHVSRRHAELELQHDRLILRDLDSVNGSFVNDKKVSECELHDGDRIRFDTLEFVVVAPAKPEDDEVAKTQIRMPQVDDADKTLVHAIAEGETVEEQVPGDFGVMAEGATAVARAWQQSEGDPQHDTNGTMVMPQTNQQDVDQGTVAMPAADMSAVSGRARLVGIAGPIEGKVFALDRMRIGIGRDHDNDIVISEASVSSHHAVVVWRDRKWHIEDSESYNGTYVDGKKQSSAVLRPGNIIGFGRVQLKFEDPDARPSLPAMPSWLADRRLLAGLAAGVLLVASYLLWQTWKPQELSFEQLWSVSSAEWQNPSTPVLLDVNRDGLLDVLLATENGRLEVLNGKNGERLFQAETVAPLRSAPLVTDIGADGKPEIIAVAASGAVQAFDADGRALWQRNPLTGDTQVINQPVAVFINDDKTADAALPTSSNGVVAIDGRNGELLWQTADRTKGKVLTRPLVDDINSDGITDIVIVTDSGQMQAFSTISGQVRINWSQQVPAVLAASPVFTATAGGATLLLVMTQSDGLLAFDSRSGNRLWQRTLPGLVLADPLPVEMDARPGSDAVIVAALDGMVTAIDPSAGEILWQHQLEAGVQARPVAHDINADGVDEVVLADTAGSINILTADGKPVTVLAAEGADHFVSAPRFGDVTGDSRPEILAVSKNGKLFVYRLLQSQ